MTIKKAPTRKEAPKTPPGKAKGKKKGPPSPPGRTDVSLPERKKPNSHKLSVYGFHHPFSFEMYIFEANEFKDGFLHPMKRFINDELDPEPAELIRANVTRLLPRRVEFSNNEKLRDDKGFLRQVIIRYPRDRKTSEETRKDGLELIASFLKDPKYSKYPPAKLECVDMTDEENFEPLDKFFLDEHIEEFMRFDINEMELDEDFVREYSDFAAKCWQGPNYSEFARGLGFE